MVFDERARSHTHTHTSKSVLIGHLDLGGVHLWPAQTVPPCPIAFHCVRTNLIYRTQPTPHTHTSTPANAKEINKYESWRCVCCTGQFKMNWWQMWPQIAMLALFIYWGETGRSNVCVPRFERRISTSMRLRLKKKKTEIFFLTLWMF